MQPEPRPPETPGDLRDLLARIEARLDVLEAALIADQDALAAPRESLTKRQVDIEKLAWAVAHGRKRPW